MKRREFSRLLASGPAVAGLGAGTLAAGGFATAATADKQATTQGQRDLSEFPVYTTRERDRRWNAVRAMMKSAGVDCLVVFGDHNPLNNKFPDNYLTNDIPNSTVVFPLDGEPAAIGGPGFMAGNWLQAGEWNEDAWVDDWYFTPGPGTIVKILKQKGFEQANIGTIGGRPQSFSGPQASGSGNSPLQPFLPKATFVELWEPFALIWATKGEEELAQFRHAAKLAEAACEAMLEVTRPGVSEAIIYAEIQYEIMRHGGKSLAVLMSSGKDNLSWHLPRWHARPQRPRIIEEGDIVMAEIFPYLATMQAQAQMCVGVGDVGDTFRKAAAISRESYEIGVKALKPGVTLGAVADAMYKPLLREGAWHLTPLVHNLNPQEWVAPALPGGDLPADLTGRFKDISRMPAKGADLVIREGMLFQLEPNACLGRQRINIGGNIIVSKTGAEELNDLPTRMRLV